MKTDSEYKPTQAFRHSKFRVLGYTALLLAIVQALNIVIRKHAIFETIIMWLVGMVLAWILVEVAYREILKIQTLTTDQLSTTTLHGERLTAMIRLISELATTFNEDEICIESIKILKEYLENLHFQLFISSIDTGELKLKSDTLSYDDQSIDDILANAKSLGETVDQIKIAPTDIPLESNGIAIGLLRVTPVYEESIDPAIVSFLNNAGQYIGVAIQNARLYTQITETTARQTRLIKATQSIIAESMHPETIYAAIHKAVLNLMPCDAFVIAFQDEVSTEIEGVFLTEREGRSTALRIPVHDNLSRHVSSTGESVRIDDYTKESKYKGVNFTDIESIRSIIATPLRRGDDHFGMISAQSYQAHAYTDEDVSLLEMLASLAAVIIDNAREFEKVQNLAYLDELSGLMNRRQLFQKGEIELKRSRRLNYPLIAIMIDIDHFKQVNDSYGHAIGDQVMKGVIDRCCSNIRIYDIFGRYGGEEFVLMLPATDIDGGIQMAERLRNSVAEHPIHTDQGPISITISLGVAQATDDINTVAGLFDRADTALYSAKNAGRNCVAHG